MLSIDSHLGAFTFFAIMRSIIDPNQTDIQITIPRIIDIRSDTASVELKQDVLDGLDPKNGNDKTLPTLLLYDDQGLRLFEKITYLEQYYLTGQEIQLLEENAAYVADCIPTGSMVIELGSGYPKLSTVRQVATGCAMTDDNAGTSVRSEFCWKPWREPKRRSPTLH